VDSENELLESHHGVLMNVSGYGILIIGSPAIGKSSLALELLSQNHQLIADDVVDFDCANNTVSGHCPAMISGLLHTRELGLISVRSVFGKQAWQSQYQLDYVIELTQQFESKTNLVLEKRSYIVLNQAFPLLTLSLTTPASLSTRLLCWLNMQANPCPAEDELQQHQYTLMAPQNESQNSP
jgi:HPr kinase/phosphorylase